MEYLLIVLCVVFVACLYAFSLLWAYRKGLNEREKVKENKPLPPLVKAPHIPAPADKEAEKRMEEYAEALNMFMNYDPYKIAREGGLKGEKS